MILIKTDKGLQVLKDRSVRLTPRQRSAFILFDGRRTVDDVLDAAVGVVQEDIDQLVELGLLGRLAQPVAQPEPVSVPMPPAEPVAPRGSVQPATESLQSLPAAVELTQPSRSPALRYRDAYPIAEKLTASVGLRGFRLHLAVEACTTCEELQALSPKIRAMLGPDKVLALDQALDG